MKKEKNLNQNTLNSKKSFAVLGQVEPIVCARHVECMLINYNIHRLSGGCKSLLGELAKPMSKSPHSGRNATRACARLDQGVFRVTGNLCRRHGYAKRSGTTRVCTKPSRNCIRGIALWVSNHIFAKPVANKLSYVDAAEIDSRISVLYPKRAQ